MRPLFTIWLVLALTGALSAAPAFFGPVPYLSTTDVPGGLYAGGAPAFLEDFEDSSLSGGLVASTGSVIGPGGLTDSVDGDDGSVNGFGTAGRSWFSGSGATGIIFTLPVGVTAAAVVWTDGSGTTTFEAFRGGTSLGTIGPVAIADGSFSGTTGEDRFFGVADPDGITSIKLSNTSGGIELDHVQYGVVPEPSSWILFVLGLVAFFRTRSLR